MIKISYLNIATTYKIHTKCLTVHAHIHTLNSYLFEYTSLYKSLQDLEISFTNVSIWLLLSWDGLELICVRRLRKPSIFSFKVLLVVAKWLVFWACSIFSESWTKYSKALLKTVKPFKEMSSKLAEMLAIFSITWLGSSLIGCRVLTSLKSCKILLPMEDDELLLCWSKFPLFLNKSGIVLFFFRIALLISAGSLRDIVKWNFLGSDWITVDLGRAILSWHSSW